MTCVEAGATESEAIWRSRSAAMTQIKGFYLNNYLTMEEEFSQEFPDKDFKIGFMTDYEDKWLTTPVYNSHYSRCWSNGNAYAIIVDKE